MTDSSTHAVFLSLNDFLGRLEPFSPCFPGEKAAGQRGGLARIATCIRTARAEYAQNVLALVAGIDLAGPLFDFFYGNMEMQALKQAGFDLGVMGIHEFEAGPGHVKQALASSDLPVLAANLEPIRPDLFPTLKDHLVFTLNGTRIGVFGLSMPAPGMHYRKGPLFREKNDYIHTAREQVRLLQKAGCQIVVAATHIGTAEDQRVAREVTGIHAVFGAHSHTPTAHPLVVEGPDKWKTLVTQAGTAGASIGKLHLHVCDGRVDMEKTSWDQVEMDETFAPDPKLHTILARAKKQLDQRLAEYIGRLDTPLDGRRKTVLNGTSDLGLLVAEAFKHVSGAHAALVSASHIQGDHMFEPGPFDWRAAYRVLPFGNAVCVFELTGGQILEMLALSANARKTGSPPVHPTDFWSGSFLYSNGLQTETNTRTGETSHLIAVDNTWQALKNQDTYLVTGTTFYLHGGDGYGLLKNVPYYNIGLSDAQCLGAYFSQKYPLGTH